jgi:hypothetical protein
MVLVLNVRLYRLSHTLRNFKLGLSNLRSTTFHKSKKRNNNVFQMGAELFLSGKTAEGEENDGRLLMGDDTGGGAVMLRRIIFQCVGIRI